MKLTIGRIDYRVFLAILGNTPMIRCPTSTMEMGDMSSLCDVSRRLAC